ncbi:hypothetical protein LNZ35_004318, partial [Salmonella enterica]|nr:hypothetical protein [Salmonella enterica]
MCIDEEFIIENKLDLKIAKNYQKKNIKLSRKTIKTIFYLYLENAYEKEMDFILNYEHVMYEFFNYLI